MDRDCRELCARRRDQGRLWVAWDLLLSYQGPSARKRADARKAAWKAIEDLEIEWTGWTCQDKVGYSACYQHVAIPAADIPRWRAYVRAFGVEVADGIG
jgi:hypothetical protein